MSSRGDRLVELIRRYAELVKRDILSEEDGSVDGNWWAKHGGIVLAFAWPALVIEAQGLGAPNSMTAEQIAVMFAHMLTVRMLGLEEK